MNKKIKVTVIIPTYNDSKHIIHSVNSVLNQSFKDYEIIVIDDGSTDDTKSVLTSYVESGQIIYLYQANSGQSIARNNGINNSNGIYIAFIDSDDEWTDKDKLKKQVDFLNDNLDYVMVGTSGVITNESKIKIIDYIVPESDFSIRQSILIKNPFIQSSVVIRKNILIEVGLFPYREDINAEDYSLWLRLGLKGKFFNLINPMTSYMLREGNTSSLKKKDILKDNINLIKKYKNNYPNYRKSLLFAYGKFFIYCMISTISNTKIKNKILAFLYKQYRRLKI